MIHITVPAIRVFGGTYIKMSQFTNELKEFGIRLGEDGYPTAVIERAVIRMEALENEVVRLTQELAIDKCAILSNN